MTDPSLPHVPMSTSGPATSLGRVLYVDDEDSLVLLGVRMLRRRGFDIRGFTDPIEALRAFEAAPMDFDAVVTDISMPEMSGFELAEAILALRADMPIVITSGSVRPVDRDHALRLGIRADIQKPNTVEELADALAGIVDERAGGRTDGDPD